MAQLITSQHVHHARPPPRNSSLILDRIKLLEESVKNKTLDVVFCGHLNAMLSMLRFYTNGRRI